MEKELKLVSEYSIVAFKDVHYEQLSKLVIR
jgi:hypothetical protein